MEGFCGAACALLKQGIERSCPNRRCRCGKDWDDSCGRSPVYGADSRCPHCGWRSEVECACEACGRRWRGVAGPVTCRCGSLCVRAVLVVSKKK